MLGVGIIIPVLAPIFFGEASILPPGTTDAMRGVLFGALSAAFPFAQFFGAPLLGALADRKGRRPILLTSLVGTCVGYLIFAWGMMIGSLPLLFIGRLLDGFTGGNISVAMATLTDVTKPEDRAKTFGMIGAAFGLGFIIGPYVGGKLADPSVVSWFTGSTPFFFAALLSLANIIMVSLRLPETLKEKVHKPMSLLTGCKNIVQAFRMPKVRTMFAIIFLVTFGFTFFTQFFQVYLVEHFAFTESRIGDVFAMIGLWIVITQGLLMRPVSARYSAVQILRVALLALACAIPALLIPQTPGMLFVFLPAIAISNGFVGPNTSAMISRLADASSQGEILGIQSSVQAVGQMLPPILAGIIAAVDVRLPMVIGGGMIFCAWIVFMFSWKGKDIEKKAQEVFHEI